MQKINKIYAWICTEPDGGQGIPAISGPDDMLMPLIGADIATIESFKPYAESLANSGTPVELVEFSTRKTLEILVEGSKQ